MSIVSLNIGVTGQVGEQVNPRRNTMVTTSSLASITASGFLNGQNTSGTPILPTDIFDVIYNYNPATQIGTYGVFQVNYASATGFSLNIWENPGNVLLPVVSGDFAIFNGTTGQIKDAGYSATNAAKTKIVMANGAVVSGNLAKFADTAGTVSDQGIAFKSVAGAAAAGGAAAQSFTDAFCTSGSCVVGNWNTQANAASVLQIVPGNGSFVVTSSADAGVGTFNYIITK